MGPTQSDHEAAAYELVAELAVRCLEELAAGVTPLEREAAGEALMARIEAHATVLGREHGLSDEARDAVISRTLADIAEMLTTAAQPG